MATTLKYKAKAVFFDREKRIVIDPAEVCQYRAGKRLNLPSHIIRFDSQHEFGVYLELCRMYGAGRVVRQFPIQIYQPGCCYPKGKMWKVDFAILTGGVSRTPFAFVEAKGAFLPEFGFTLAALEQLHPRLFGDLYIVFGASIPVRNEIVSSLFKTEADYRLFTLKEMKCLQYLPSPL